VIQRADYKLREMNEVIADDRSEIGYNSKIVKEYVLGEVLGEGSYGKVYEALSTKTNQVVALKVAKRKNLQKIPNGEESIMKEIDILNCINHRNIVKLLDFFASEDNRTLYMVLEHVEGGTLRELANKSPKHRLPLSQARDLFKQLVTALDYLHNELGLIHGDVKPDNILVTVDGVLKLLDLGSAKEIAAHKDGRPFCKCNGSPAFQPPEIASGQNIFSGPEMDIWAAGVTLYIMTVGKFPFEGSNVCTLFHNITNGTFLIPDSVSASLADLIRAMLTVDYHKRITLEQIKNHPFMNMKLHKEEFIHVDPVPTRFRNHTLSHCIIL